MRYIRCQQPGGIDFVIREREGSVIGLGAGITGKVVPAFYFYTTYSRRYLRLFCREQETAIGNAEPYQ